MSDFSETLGWIEGWVAANRPEYHATLRPGVEATALTAAGATMGHDLPADFAALYRWHDGQDPNEMAALFENWMFMTLADVVDVKDLLDGMIGYDFEDPETWRRGWIPFLSNGGGSYLCLDLEARGGTVGQLIEFWKGDADRPVVAPSLAAWFETVRASMADGTYTVL